MANPEVAVVDASVGVKWFRREAGTDEALALLTEAAEGGLTLVADHLFLYEVLSVLHRRSGSVFAARAYDSLRDARIALIGPDPTLVAAALRQAEALDCDLYDAFSAGLASLLEARLFSADRKAHERYPDATFIGE